MKKAIAQAVKAWVSEQQNRDKLLTLAAKWKSVEDGCAFVQGFLQACMELDESEFKKAYARVRQWMVRGNLPWLPADKRISVTVKDGTVSVALKDKTAAANGGRSGGKGANGKASNKTNNTTKSTKPQTLSDDELIKLVAARAADPEFKKRLLLELL